MLVTNQFLFRSDFVQHPISLPVIGFLSKPFANWVYTLCWSYFLDNDNSDPHGSAMQTLLFEVQPRQGHEEHYFTHAAKLRPILMQHDGLLFIERYRSLSREGVVLSHSLWRDEASIARWRTEKHHHQSQAAGRYKHFKDYRIRISHALVHYDEEGEQHQWSTAGMYAENASADARYLTIIRAKAQPNTEYGECFESVTEANSFISIAEVASEEAGQKLSTSAQGDSNTITVIFARVSRDYGMYERTEAPQFFAPVQ